MSADKYPHVLKDQPVMSTMLDSQGERRSKEFLEELINRMPPRYPLGQDHDMRKEIIGYFENFRLERVPGEENEWRVIADICVKDRKHLDDPSRGFSFSWVEVTMKANGGSKGCVYLPFPCYNDDDLMGKILDHNAGIAVGKWYKKEAEPEVIYLIASFAIFIIQPAWEKFYNEHVHAFLCNAVEKCKKYLGKDKIIHFAMDVYDGNNHKVQLIFLPDRTRPYDTLDSEFIKLGINVAVEYIENDLEAQQNGVSKIKLYYHDDEKGYCICNVDFSDGSSRSLV